MPPGMRLSILAYDFWKATRAMALGLKDKETDRLARELASLTGETLTEAVRHPAARAGRRELCQGDGRRAAAFVVGGHAG